MDEGTGMLPGLPAVAGKPVHVTFDGGLMTWTPGYYCWPPSSSGSGSPSAWPIASRTGVRPSGFGIRSPK